MCWLAFFFLVLLIAILLIVLFVQAFFTETFLFHTITIDEGHRLKNNECKLSASLARSPPTPVLTCMPKP